MDLILYIGLGYSNKNKYRTKKNSNLTLAFFITSQPISKPYSLIKIKHICKTLKGFELVLN